MRGSQNATRTRTRLLEQQLGRPCGPAKLYALEQPWENHADPQTVPLEQLWENHAHTQSCNATRPAMEKPC